MNYNISLENKNENCQAIIKATVFQSRSNPTPNPTIYSPAAAEASRAQRTSSLASIMCSCGSLTSSFFSRPRVFFVDKLAAVLPATPKSPAFIHPELHNRVPKVTGMGTWVVQTKSYLRLLDWLSQSCISFSCGALCRIGFFSLMRVYVINPFHALKASQDDLG